MAQPIGTFCFVLHSHIPYVISHGRSPHGTDWLSEAAAETYLPLLDVCSRLIEEGISPKITVGLTPILVEQLTDQSFKNEFSSYLRAKMIVCTENEASFKVNGNYHMAYLARYWFDWYGKALYDFEQRYSRDIVEAFATLQHQGHIEIITSSATHGYSALLSEDSSIQAQVKQGIASYVTHFGRSPSGYWLPECSYRPRYHWTNPLSQEDDPPVLRKGVDEFLSENGIKYFFVDGPMLTGGQLLGPYGEKFGPLNSLWKNSRKEIQTATSNKYSPFRAYDVNSSGDPDHQKLAVLGRDSSTGVQVWSGEHGYPGDEWYLEFHKKHVGPDDRTLGLRYWRISENKEELGTKELYEPHRSESRSAVHADHFASLVKLELENQNDPDSVMCSVYDTELFGHWWFEGPNWLYHTIRALSKLESVQLRTVSEYLESVPARQSVSLPEGSWGEGGFHYIWLNEQTAWSWKLVYEVESEMKEMAVKYANNHAVTRVIKQAAREALLLMASDWQFCISSGGAKDYSEVRLRNHYENFKALRGLVDRIAAGQQLSIGDWKNVEECELRDSVFANTDPSWFANVDHPAIES